MDAPALIVLTPDDGDPDVAALVRTAAEVGYSTAVLLPDAALPEADAPVVLAGHRGGILPAFAAYRDLEGSVGAIGLGEGGALPAGACRLEIAAGADVAAAARPWLAGIARWRGPSPPDDAETEQILASERGDAAQLLADVAAFHASSTFVDRCCVTVARSATDPRLRAAAVVALGDGYSVRWYGASAEAWAVIHDLGHDPALRALDPRVERAVDDFMWNLAP